MPYRDLMFVDYPLFFMNSSSKVLQKNLFVLDLRFPVRAIPKVELRNHTSRAARTWLMTGNLEIKALISKRI